VFPRGCIAQLPHRGLFGLPRRYWAGKLPEPDYMSMSGCLAFPSQCALFALRYVPLKVRGSSELHKICAELPIRRWHWNALARISNSSDSTIFALLEPGDSLLLSSSRSHESHATHDNSDEVRRPRLCLISLNGNETTLVLASPCLQSSISFESYRPSDAYSTYFYRT